jgi:tetratricopeptide (TPR) repeat protein
MSYEIGFDLASTYAYLRRYEDAIALADHVIALDPNVPYAYSIKAMNLIRWNGDTKGAQAVLADAPVDSESAAIVRALLAYMARDCVDGLPAATAHPQTIYVGQEGPMPLALLTARLLDVCKRTEDARASYRFALDQLEAHRAAHPEDFRVLVFLSHALAGLGDRESAIEHMAEAAERCGGRDFLACTFIVGEAAAMLARVGEPERSLDLLDWLLSMPSGMSLAWIAADPSFDSMRDHPRYRELTDGPR